MDKSIEQMSQDLARAGYAESTRKSYLRTVTELWRSFDKPVTQITRDELRDHVQKLAAHHKSAATLGNRLVALMFLYRRTLGRPDYVSFIKLPKRRSCLPTVLSAEEVDARPALPRRSRTHSRRRRRPTCSSRWRN